MAKTQTVAVVAVIAAVIAIIAGVAITQTDDTIEIITDTPDQNATESELIEKKLSEIQNKTQSIEDLLESEYDPTRPREWQTSGPFQIDRKVYYLGEKVFLRIGGLQFDDKGQITFLRQTNATHYEVYQSIPFDGVDKPAFNYYIQPQLSKSSGLCSADDIAVEWRVVFRGTDYPNLEFQYLNKTIPGEEEKYLTSVC